MSAKHTPGPWVFKREVHKGDVDHIATVAWVADIRVGRDCGAAYLCNYESHGTNEVDARLIAAAPELLEALEDAVGELEALAKARDSDYARPDPDCITRLRAAISKATGVAS